MKKHLSKIFILLNFIFLKEIKSQCTAANIPYQEGFESITINNQLPACMVATGLGSAVTTYTAPASQGRQPANGNCFAAFASSVSGTNYIFFRGLNLVAGITYSTGFWWTTNYIGSIGWQSLSIMMGVNQNTTSLQILTSITNPMSGPFQVLGGTFTVATSGVYYIAIAATGTPGGAPYLSVDDFFVSMPCTVLANQALLTLSISSNPVCPGEVFTVNVITSNNTTVSSNSSTISLNQTSILSSVGTNTLTGCVAISSINVFVKPKPQISALASPPLVCSGNKVTLSAQGNALVSYTWSNGSNSPITTFSPIVTTTCIVNGLGSNGCIGSASVVALVNPNPTISAYIYPPTICDGGRGTCTLYATGANNYLWTILNYSQVSTSVTFSAISQGNYTFSVFGVDANGCGSTSLVYLFVTDCAGLKSNGILNSEIEIFPIPAREELHIETNVSCYVEIINSFSQKVFSKNIFSGHEKIDVSQWSKGIYFLKIKSKSGIETKKIVVE